jgi:hypothetical protein
MSLIPASSQGISRNYHLDWLTTGMLCGASLDTVTTWWVLSHRLGREANPVAAPLFHVSLWWIPIYLLCRPLLVPFLPKIPRDAFAVFYFLLGIGCGLNNLGGILYHNYFLVRRYGITGITAFWVIVACVFFLMAQRQCRGSQERLAQLKVGLRWVVCFLAIEAAFLLVSMFSVR